jgi:CRP/FNR family transcriptional regulator, anaerobic regulatory protein
MALCGAGQRCALTALKGMPVSPAFFDLVGACLGLFRTELVISPVTKSIVSDKTSRKAPIVQWPLTNDTFGTLSAPVHQPPHEANMIGNLEVAVTFPVNRNVMVSEPVLWDRAAREARLDSALAVSTSTSKPVAELLRLMGCQPSSITAIDEESTVAVRHVRAGVSLLAEGTRATHLYVVRAGTFKAIKTAEDGYEQVMTFAGTGEVLGFEALCESRQPLGAIALEDASVFALPVSELDGLRQKSPALDRALQVALSRQLMRAGAVTEMMAAVSSEVRLARFIGWWAARMAEHGQSPRRLRLRMSRRDIASLLGIAHETVSRSFSAFVERGLLRVDNREIEILDAAGLKECTRNTRGLSEEAGNRAVKPASCRAAPWRSAQRAGQLGEH